jgi:hypothetical protein
VFDLLGEWILRKICSSLVGVFGQGIDDQLEVRIGGGCMASRRHEDNGWFVPSEGMGVVRENGIKGTQTRTFGGPVSSEKKSVPGMARCDVASRVASLHSA